MQKKENICKHDSQSVLTKRVSHYALHALIRKISAASSSDETCFKQPLHTLHTFQIHLKLSDGSEIYLK